MGDCFGAQSPALAGRDAAAPVRHAANNYCNFLDQVRKTLLTAMGAVDYRPPVQRT